MTILIQRIQRATVEAPGIENDQRRAVDTIEHEKGTIGVRAVSANVPDRASKCAIDRGDVTESSGAVLGQCRSTRESSLLWLRDRRVRTDER